MKIKKYENNIILCGSSSFFFHRFYRKKKSWCIIFLLHYLVVVLDHFFSKSIEIYYCFVSREPWAMSKRVSVTIQNASRETAMLRRNLMWIMCTRERIEMQTDALDRKNLGHKKTPNRCQWVKWNESQLNLRALCSKAQKKLKKFV